MMERVRISPHAITGERFIFYGKPFPVLGRSSCSRILIHQDFPAITETGMDDFESYARKSGIIVVSACRCRVHPYRIMTVDDEGNERYLMDIDRDVRGYRQRYPDVFVIKPSLVFIPPGRVFGVQAMAETPDLYIMDENLLFDREQILESLMINQGDLL